MDFISPMLGVIMPAFLVFSSKNDVPNRGMGGFRVKNYVSGVGSPAGFSPPKMTFPQNMWGVSFRVNSFVCGVGAPARFLLSRR